MKPGWQSKQLGDLCLFLNGLWKGKKPPFTNVGVVRNTNFAENGTLDDSDVAYLDVETRQLEKRQLEYGDIILEKSGGGPKQPVGRVALFDWNAGAFSFSNFTSALRVIHPREIDFHYLHRYLHWKYLEGVTAGMQSHSTGIRNLNLEAYKGISVSFPSLPEQKRIVGILDKAFEAIGKAKANAEKNLFNSSTLFENYLKTIFRKLENCNRNEALGEFCELISGQHIDASDYNSSGLGVGYLTGPSDFGPSSPTVTKWTQVPKRMAKKNDVLITVKGSGVGKVNFLSLEEVAISRQLMALRSMEVDYRYLYFFLLTKFDYYQALSRGAAIPGISREDVLELKCPLPDPPQIDAIVMAAHEVLGLVARLNSSYVRELRLLEELKVALLRQAFSGAI